jgi:hypothetical protein
MQQELLGENVVKLIENKSMRFEYNDKGSMATG